MLHARELGLPGRYETVVFQDGSEEFNEFERDLWGVVLEGVTGMKGVTDFRYLRKNRKDLDYGRVDMQVPKECCFDRVYSTIRGDIYATSVEDMDAFKQSASKALEISAGNPNSCPPNRIAIITRSTGMGLRKIMNLPQLLKLLRKLTNNSMEIDIISPSEKNTLAEQARMFSSYGILISSHSSQLTNLVFAHANSVVIELSPIYKRAFRHLVSLSKRFDELIVGKGGNKSLACDFDRMVTEMEFRCGLTQEEHVLLSRADYVVHMKRFRVAVEEGLNQLKSVCQK
ncbi:UNVERIFIED_CONTAM: hypothetical protein HDU68_011343 [Siphonaria sp. JEL0065]|nr:hypothetical protein HDU68_011343 [Siphonaria sp. JEL0065]